MRLGLGSEIRRCVFTNYCEGLDQVHKQVTCKLWDRKLDAGATLASDGKRRLVAPRWVRPTPLWPEGGAGLDFELEGRDVVLTWRAARARDGVRGYLVYRARPDGAYLELARTVEPRFVDREPALPGRYYVVAAGALDGSEPSNGLLVT